MLFKTNKRINNILLIISFYCIVVFLMITSNQNRSIYNKFVVFMECSYFDLSTIQLNEQKIA